MANVKILHATVEQVLGDKANKVILALDEVTVECAAENYIYFF